MDVRISHGGLRGALQIPPSKSASHRALICAALAAGESRLRPLVRTEDMNATMRCVEALGARTAEKDGALAVRGVDAPASQATLDCGESGSTLRFLVPVAGALGVRARFTGRGRLPSRPMTPLTDVMAAHGARCTAGEGGEILRLEGRLSPGEYRIAGDISSQYVTGLLFALPLLDGDSEIVLTTPLQSRGYVDLTLQMMARCAIDVYPSVTGWRIPGGQRYQPVDCDIEGDYSSAAFWLCAGALGSRLTLTGLDTQSLQGDRAIVQILRRMGAQIEESDKGLAVAPPPGGILHGVDIDATDIPDLVPVLAATAALAQGVTNIQGARRLRLKESDRLHTTTELLQALGACIVEMDDGLFITGKPELRGGGAVSSHADHRIAMSAAIAALRCAAPVTVNGAECVNKSYPEFFDHFRILGGTCHVL